MINFTRCPRGTKREYRSAQDMRHRQAADRKQEPRVDVLWNGLRIALQEESSLNVLSAWLQLAGRWDFLPSFHG